MQNSCVNDFLDYKLVVLIRRSDTESDMDALQDLIDKASLERGKDRPRFGRHGEIKNFVKFQKDKGTSEYRRDRMCISYGDKNDSDDNRMYWCDIDYYRDKGMEVCLLEDFISEPEGTFDDFSLIFA